MPILTDRIKEDLYDILSGLPQAINITLLEKNSVM